MATADDDVREIQLSGKQLVFLFMAVTVVSVVIFLCGVLVGRGVQSRVGPTAAATVQQTAPAEEPADPTAPVTPAAEAPPGPTKTPALGFQDRLEAKGAPSESLTPRATAPAPPAKAAAPENATASAGTSAAVGTLAGAKPAASAPATTPAAAAAPPEVSRTYPEPRGDGFAIQVAALTGRTEAEAVASRLKSKGYAVYLVSALPGQPAGFKVRVGKFKARAEAETIATRLEREEQFKPWITR